MTDWTTSETVPETVVPQQRRPAHEARIPSVQDRIAFGKRTRRAVPLELHAEVGRPTVDVLAVLARDERGRVEELLPVRHARMVASPFAFYRGAAAVMAADLAPLPDSGLFAQLCGDAHLANFGVFATPERRLLFDVNDFDETLPGPFEWDVKRLAASIALAARANGHRAADRRKTLVATVASYRKTVREFARMRNLDVWYASLDIERAVAELGPAVTAEDRRRTEARLTKARARDSVDAVRKLTVRVGRETRFAHEPPLLVPLDELLPQADAAVTRERLAGIVADYRSTLSEDRRHLLDQFQLVDIARKVVGVGSVGTRAWVLLLTGRDDSDPLVLQAKEARASVLERHCGPSEFDNAGQRVVAGQRLVQAASDIFLGWQRGVGLDGQLRDFYVRQLLDGKASADPAGMNPRRLTLYGRMCAWTLARAHARSGDRVAIAAYLGKKETFEQALAEFAEAYADRAESQHRVLREAVDRGELAASTG